METWLQEKRRKNYSNVWSEMDLRQKLRSNPKPLLKDMKINIPRMKMFYSHIKKSWIEKHSSLLLSWGVMATITWFQASRRIIWLCLRVVAHQGYTYTSFYGIYEIWKRLLIIHLVRANENKLIQNILPQPFSNYNPKEACIFVQRSVIMKCFMRYISSPVHV